MSISSYLQWFGVWPALVAVSALALCTVLGLAALSSSLSNKGRAWDDPSHWPAPLWLFLGATLGMALVMLALFVLGCMGLLTAPVVALVLGLAGVASLWRLWRLRAWAAQALRAGPGAGPGTVLALAVLLWLVWRAVQPPGLWDDTMYQLPQARLFAQTHALAVDPYLRFPLFPYNANLLFAAALLFGNEVDAQILATLPLFLIGLGLLGLGRQLTGSYFAGWLAVLVLAGLGPVSEALGYAYVDNHLALYAWAGLVSLVLALQSEPGTRLQRVCLLLCGVFMGTAAGIKLFGVLMAAGVLILVLLNQRSMGRAWIFYVVAGSVFGLGWYLRSFLISGDPIHPLGGAWFGHYLWTAEDLASARTEQATHGAARGWDMGWRALQVAGLLPLVPALFAPLWRRWRGRLWWALYAAFLGYLLFWLFSSQVARYTAPLWAVGSLLSAACLYAAVHAAWQALRLNRVVLQTWERGRPLARWGLGLGLSALVMVHGQQAFSQRAAAWNATLAARPGYELFMRAGALASEHGPVLLQLGFENAVYFFGGTVVGDWFGPGRYGQMLRCTDGCRPVPAEELAAVLRRHGATMVAINTRRFPAQAQDYDSRFRVVLESPQGLLLVLKPKPESQE